MDQLEICAEIFYVRPLSYYLEIDSRQTIMGFVHGDCAPVQEFRGLEQFRRAIIKLVEEGLARPEGCGESMAPHVRIILKAGQDFLKPIHEFDIAIARENSVDAGVWTVQWKEDGNFRRGCFPNSAPALSVMKAVLDEITAKWASAVVFETKASDSRGTKEKAPDE